MKNRTWCALLAFFLVLGCCSAWRPDAAESYARGRQALRS